MMSAWSRGGVFPADVCGQRAYCISLITMSRRSSGPPQRRLDVYLDSNNSPALLSRYDPRRLCIEPPGAVWGVPRKSRPCNAQVYANPLQ
jgi:hypothetical protein